MATNSERVYWWIDAKAERLGKWLESNLIRVAVIAFFAWIAVWGFLLEDKVNLDIYRRLVRSLGPTLAGIVIATVTVEALAQRRLEQERRDQLARQMSSRYRDVTEVALTELDHKGWLRDGSLQGSLLAGADLSEARLAEASLCRADLHGANLRRANLWSSDLREVDLTRADLTGARLDGADLRRAALEGANLDRAWLDGADLREVRGWTIEQLKRVGSLEGVLMPDGVQLEQRPSGYRERISGPTFEEWKGLFLEEHGGTDVDVRSCYKRSPREEITRRRDRNALADGAHR